MPYLGWASMGGNEIVSTSRVASYARGITVMCTCPDLPAALGDEQYSHPATDPAPWYDKAVPESGDFWGVLGLEITGASSSTLSVPFTSRVRDGAVAGAPRREAREIEFKVMLMARTEAALSYGLSWLSAALRGAACQPGCTADNLCLLAGCPEPPEISAADPADCGMSPDGEPARTVPRGDDGPARADGRDTNDADDRGGESQQQADERMPNRRKPNNGDDQENKQGAAKPVRDPTPDPKPKPEPAPAPKEPQGGPTYPPAGDGPPPTSEKGPPDPAVMDTVWLVGHHRQVPPKVMLAAFETVLVESNGRNLDHGDRDSVGAFQQRPSQGWGSPQQCMNVHYAATQFFDRAVPKDQEQPDLSPGRLAQAVQRSAYPDRYDQREGQARQEIDAAKQRTAQKPQPPPEPDPPKPPPPEPDPAPQPEPQPDEGSGNEQPSPQPNPDTGSPNQNDGQGNDNAPDDGESDWDPYETATRYLRHAYDVGLLEFGDDLEMARANGAHTATLSFTLKTGNPAFYSEPVSLVDTRKRDQTQPVKRDTVPDYRIDQLAQCPDPVDCLTQSPYLQGKGPWGDEPFPGSNPADPFFQDPGYPTKPFTARRAIYHSPGNVTGEWFEKVPIIQVHSGGRDMHRVTVRFHANPRGKPELPEQLDPCDLCGEITLPWIPARTKVTLDGRTESVDVKCPDGGVHSSDVQLYGPRGGLLQWPVFDCGMPLWVEVIAQDGTLAADAWYRIQWSAKSDAV